MITTRQERLFDIHSPGSQNGTLAPPVATRKGDSAQEAAEKMAPMPFQAAFTMQLYNPLYIVIPSTLAPPAATRKGASAQKAAEKMAPTPMSEAATSDGCSVDTSHSFTCGKSHRHV